MVLPSISVIILNWNGLDDTRRCLDSLRQQNYPNVDVFVIDNGSHRDEAQILRQEYPEITALRYPNNLGFAEGNALTVQKLKRHPYDYLLYLNNDTIITSDFLTPLVDFAEQHPDVGIVGPTVFYADKPEMIWSAGGNIDWSGGLFVNRFQNQKLTEVTPKKVDYINGCCMLVKREVVDLCGSFDPEYFAYVEDVDLNVRAHHHGFTSYYVPSAHILHAVSSASGGEGSIFKEKLLAKNIVLFVRKNYMGRERLHLLFEVYRYKLHQVLIYIRHRHLPGIWAILSGLFEGQTQTR